MAASFTAPWFVSRCKQVVETPPAHFSEPQCLCENLNLVDVAPAFRRACACIYSVSLKADATKAFLTHTLQPGEPVGMEPTRLVSTSSTLKAGQVAEAAAAPTRIRWRVVALVAFVTGLTYVDRLHRG